MALAKGLVAHAVKHPFRCTAERRNRSTPLRIQYDVARFCCYSCHDEGSTASNPVKRTMHHPWDQARAAAVIADHAKRPGAALPILHALQDAFGYIDDAAVPAMAEALNLSRAEVLGTISFYHDFRRAPAGRHVLKLCRAEACQAAGCEPMHAHAKRRLGVDWHATTADGAVTLEPVFCLGLCACGPAALLDGEPIARLDAAAFDDLLSEVRA